MFAMIIVFAFPPNESCKTYVEKNDRATSITTTKKSCLYQSVSITNEFLIIYCKED